ncbi:hypothetical protein MICRO8M_60004 [Microbacterium sp. 8M]|nr:hypothetical protein MICRO8M_60004 [Microbacterium sp. 8M]
MRGRADADPGRAAVALTLACGAPPSVLAAVQPAAL